MREYTKKPENQSRTLDSNPKTSKQAPISEILQVYRDQTFGKPVQRQNADEEELLQAKAVQQDQVNAVSKRYSPDEDDELLQGKFDTLQRETIDEEEILQGKFETTSTTEQSPIQREEKPNNTGLPDNMKIGVENLSGYSVEDVRVHYNSDKPTQLNALAYTQGTDIHVASGQEKYLPHELGHVIQQMKGKVSPTAYLNSVPVNDDPQLEKEADNYAGAIQMKKYRSLSDNCIGRIIPKNNIVQKRHINQDLDVLQDEGESDMQTMIKLPGNKDNLPVDHRYILKLYSTNADNNQTNDINKVREKISLIGKTASKEKILTTMAGDAYFPVANVQNKIKEHAKYAPFIAQIKNYGIQDGGFNEIKMDVLFAKEGYGYIVKINNNKMKNRENPDDVQPQVGYMNGVRNNWADDADFVKTDYSRGHHASDNLLSESPTDFLAENNAQNADNITKIVGEGSRWVAVADLSNQGHLKDSSVFYVNSDNIGAKPPQIIFSQLWRTWAKKPFLNRFGISKEELKKAVNNDVKNGIQNFITKNEDRKTMNQLVENDENYNLG